MPYTRPGSQRLSRGGSDCGIPRNLCAFRSHNPVLFTMEIKVVSIYDMFLSWISDICLRVLRIFECHWSPHIPITSHVFFHTYPCYPQFSTVLFVCHPGPPCTRQLEPCGHECPTLQHKVCWERSEVAEISWNHPDEILESYWSHDLKGKFGYFFNNSSLYRIWHNLTRWMHRTYRGAPASRAVEVEGTLSEMLRISCPMLRQNKPTGHA